MNPEQLFLYTQYDGAIIEPICALKPSVGHDDGITLNLVEVAILAVPDLPR